MSRTGNTGASTFVSSLLIVIQPTAENPLTSEPRFMAAVNTEIDAAIAESGVTDAKVIADVKAVMVEKGKGVLKGATTLAALSDFVGSVKEQAQVLAKTLDAVAKTRAKARDAAATTIALSSGLGRGHVLNNLDMTSISSGSGKLRFLYDDIVSQAKKGPVDYIATVNKASTIVTDFANDKIAMLKAVNEAGFDPVERAHYEMLVLKTSSWRDASIVSTAKELAGNDTVKAAFKSLAGLLKPEHAATLDAREIGAGFQMFAAVFSQEILTKYQDIGQKTAESSDLQQLLQMMTTSLLEKEHPEMAASLARLAESGKLPEVGDYMSAALTKTRALKMDYMTLEQAGLTGQPNNEPIRSVLKNPNLVYDQAKYDQSVKDVSILNVANSFFCAMTADFPTKGAFTDADKYIAGKLTGGQVMQKYGEGLPSETQPILKKLVDRLDWRPNSAAKSEEIVGNFVKDLKNWRDIAPGSGDSAGIENVMQRRMNEYLVDVMNGQTQSSGFENVNGADVFLTFMQDLPRINYTLNGSTMQPKRASEMLDEFKKALGNDPAKVKALSVVANQQIFGEFTTAVSNRIALPGWKRGQEEEDIANVPNIEKFASRDITKTGCPFFDSGNASFEIDIAPDGNSAKIRAKSESPMRGDYTLMDKGKDVGKCVITQEFTLEFGAEPVIKDLKIGQTFA
jgi:hypothetical protein